MTPNFCNVALPVPLRTTFTYTVPESLRESVACGSRVLVPFRKKTLVGVVARFAENAPEGAAIREISRVLDSVPALTPKLIELARWIAGYYQSPVGEDFRAMLPPVVEVKTQRRIVLTEAGREAIRKISAPELLTGVCGCAAAAREARVDRNSRNGGEKERTNAAGYCVEGI